MKDDHVFRNKIQSFICPVCHNKSVYDTEKDIYRPYEVDYDDLCICEECGAELYARPQYDGTIKFEISVESAQDSSIFRNGYEIDHDDSDEFYFQVFTYDDKYGLEHLADFDDLSDATKETYKIDDSEWCIRKYFCDGSDSYEVVECSPGWKDDEVLSSTNSCNIMSADYGGAYDIDPEMFFTKEELVELGNDVAERFDNWDKSEPDKASSNTFELADVSMDTSNNLYMDISDGDTYLSAVVRIDMRKIRKPSDINKYSDQILAKLKADYMDYMGYREISECNNIMSSVSDSLKSKIHKKASSAMEDFGFPKDEVDDYLSVEVEDNFQSDFTDEPMIKVEVRAELSYESLTELCDELNPIVEKYDDQAYFEPVTGGIIDAYIRKSVVKGCDETDRVTASTDSFFDWYDSLSISNQYKVDDIADEEGLPYYEDASESDLDWLMERCQNILSSTKIKSSTDSDEDFENYEDDIKEIDQEFTSENTSINSTKLPAVFKMVSFEPGTVNIDYGGGRFDNVADYLSQYDVINLVYDPYNRTPDHNREVVKMVKDHGGADTATCSNVLNVIKEREVRINVLNNIKKLVKPSGEVYITVYEGTGKGDEGATKSGYQLNRKTADYMEEIQEVFPDARRKGKLIVAHPQGSVSSANMIDEDSVDFKLDGGDEIMAGWYDYPEPNLDPPEDPYSYMDDEVHYYTDMYNNILTVNEDGSWDYDDDFRDYLNKMGFQDETYRDITLDDDVGVMEKIDELIEDKVPEEPGKYKISCDVDLVYDIDGIAYMYGKYEEDGIDYYTDMADVSWNKKRSKVTNLKIEKIEE